MRLTCAATLLASMLLTAACGSNSTTADPVPPTTTTASAIADTRWAAPVSNMCDLVTTAEAAAIFAVSNSDVSALDSGTSEHDDPGFQCTYSAHSTHPAHMVNVSMVGTGGNPDGLDSRGYFTKWSKESEKDEHRQVTKLGDDDFCILTAGGQGPLPMLVIVAGQRLLTLTAYESTDSCDTLVRFAQTALPRLNG